MSMSPIVNTGLLTEREAASFLRVQPATLRNWRVTGKHGLAFIRCGGGIRYSMEVLKQWVASRTVGGKSDGSAPPQAA